MIKPLRPVRGILNLPAFEWAGIYTTNYDQIIERSYELARKPLHVVSSNFDYPDSMDATRQLLYKLHGSIQYDVCFGDAHRLIISAADYDVTNDFREILYAKFTEQLFTNDAIIIGSSLADPDLRIIIDNATRIKRQKGAPGKLTLFVYEEDENQALIYGTRGLDVCFGGIDSFFFEMSKQLAHSILLPGVVTSPLDRARQVHPSTLSVSCARANQTGNLARMFNGAAANYADIMRGWTFQRDFTERLESQLADRSCQKIACVLGAAGSGKTSGVRQALTRLVDRGIECWEHDKQFALPVEPWAQIDEELRKRKEVGILLVDDAHESLYEVNALVDKICEHSDAGLKLVLVSSRPHWNPRLKSPALFKNGTIYELGPLSPGEINSLLDILQSSLDISALVERSFMGFNRTQRQRRLTERCRADMFVCMKNIFASESFDVIILREYGELIEDYQQVYRRVAVMESAGVRVHRQLVLRCLGISANQVARYLEDLEGIIEETTVDFREGIFAWRVRHAVIADIIAKYKVASEDELYKLLAHTIDSLSPAYPIELASMNEMCDPQKGISRIYNKERQNILLRKMISLAPRQRVPRHRLITNLINLGEFDQANTEIRLFENELRIDGPVQRYKVRLFLERAKHSTGLLDEDRAMLIQKAASLAETGIDRFPFDKNIYKEYLEVGVASYKCTGESEIFSRALGLARAAYDKIQDPDLDRTVRRFEQIQLHPRGESQPA